MDKGKLRLEIFREEKKVGSFLKKEEKTPVIVGSIATWATVSPILRSGEVKQ